MLSSRFSIWLLPFMYCFLFFFIEAKQKIKFLFIFSYFLLIPYFFSSSLYHYKVDEFLKNSQPHEIPERVNIGKIKNNELVDNELVDIDKYSSGRIAIWKEGLKIFLANKQILTGLGHQSDRRYLHNNNKVNNFYGSNMSNGLLNALVSSGLIGFTFLILFNLFILKKIYFLIKIEKIFKKGIVKNFYIISSLIIFLILNLRILIENSYTVFGVDFLLYLISTFILINNIKFKKFYF